MGEDSGELLKPFVGERYGAVQDGAKIGQVEPSGLGIFAKHDNDAWDEEEVTDLVFEDALEHTREAELGHDYDRAAAIQQEQQVVEYSIYV